MYSSYKYPWVVNTLIDDTSLLIDSPSNGVQLASALRACISNYS